MTDNIVDIASFSETKLNSSLPDAQFQIDNFTGVIGLEMAAVA